MKHIDEVKNAALLDRISKAEDDLRSVISGNTAEPSVATESRVYSTANSSLVPSSYTPRDPAREREEALARDRWREEIQARKTELDSTGDGFATNSAVWDQGAPTSPYRSMPIQREDVQGVAQAIMARVGTGGNSLNVDSLESGLQGTPYSDFAAWFLGAVDMEGATSVTMGQLEAVVGQYLQESTDSSVSKALHAGGMPEKPFLEGETSMFQATPQANSVGTRAGDLVSYIQQSAHREGSPKASSQARSKVLLHMTVEIGDGRTDTIDVHEGDDPILLADEFCRMHDLSVNVVEPLAEHIQTNVTNVRPPLTSPKKKAPTPAPATNNLHHTRKVNGAEVGRRLSETPTRTPRQTMDPFRRMPASSNIGGSYTPVLDAPETDHFDELNMSPQTTRAVRKMESRKLKSSQQSQLDERGSNAANSMRSGRSGAGNVFSRLNREAQDRKKKHEERVEKKRVEEEMKIEAEIKREKLLFWGNTENAGGNKGKPLLKRLYYEDLDRRKKKINDLVEAKKQAEEKELKELEEKRNKVKWAGKSKETAQTKEYVPIISKKGKAAQSRVMQDWDGKEKKKRLEKLRRQQAEDEMAECTFDVKTTIANSEDMGHGARSKKLVDRMVNEAGEQNNGDRFEALYSDAKSRQLRTEQYENWFPEDETFHPDIGKNKDMPSLDATEDDFINRLTYSKQVQPAPEFADRDEDTGQPLFHPRTGRAPLFNRNSADLPIGDYLYASGLEQQEEKERRCFDAELEMQNSANQPIATSNSQHLTEGMRRRRLREIFEMIDADGDGIIDPAAANEAGMQGMLPKEVADEIVPVVIAVAQPLDYEQFFHLISAEISYSQSGPRQYLVPERLRHLRSL
jgi:hypothetical protein